MLKHSTCWIYKILVVFTTVSILNADLNLGQHPQTFRFKELLSRTKRGISKPYYFHPLGRRRQPKIQPKIQTEIHPKIQSNIQPKIQPEIEPKIWPKIQPKIQPEIQPKIQYKIQPKIETHATIIETTEKNIHFTRSNSTTEKYTTTLKMNSNPPTTQKYTNKVNLDEDTSSSDEYSEDDDSFGYTDQKVVAPIEKIGNHFQKMYYEQIERPPKLFIWDKIGQPYPYQNKINKIGSSSIEQSLFPQSSFEIVDEPQMIQLNLDKLAPSLNFRKSDKLVLPSEERFSVTSLNTKMKTEIEKLGESLKIMKRLLNDKMGPHVQLMRELSSNTKVGQVHSFPQFSSKEHVSRVGPKIEDLSHVNSGQSVQNIVNFDQEKTGKSQYGVSGLRMPEIGKLSHKIPDLANAELIGKNPQKIQQSASSNKIGQLSPIISNWSKPELGQVKLHRQNSSLETIGKLQETVLNSTDEQVKASPQNFSNPAIQKMDNLHQNLLQEKHNISGLQAKHIGHIEQPNSVLAQEKIGILPIEEKPILAKSKIGNLNPKWPQIPELKIAELHALLPELRKDKLGALAQLLPYVPRGKIGSLAHLLASISETGQNIGSKAENQAVIQRKTLSKENIGTLPELSVIEEKFGDLSQILPSLPDEKIGALAQILSTSAQLKDSIGKQILPIIISETERNPTTETGNEIENTRSSSIATTTLPRNVLPLQVQVRPSLSAQAFQNLPRSTTFSSVTVSELKKLPKGVHAVTLATHSFTIDETSVLQKPGKPFLTAPAATNMVTRIATRVESLTQPQNVLATTQAIDISPAKTTTELEKIKITTQASPFINISEPYFGTAVQELPPKTVLATTQTYEAKIASPSISELQGLPKHATGGTIDFKPLTAYTAVTMPKNVLAGTTTSAVFTANIAALELQTPPNNGLSATTDILSTTVPSSQRRQLQKYSLYSNLARNILTANAAISKFLPTPKKMISITPVLDGSETKGAESELQKPPKLLLSEGRASNTLTDSLQPTVLKPTQTSLKPSMTLRHANLFITTPALSLQLAKNKKRKKKVKTAANRTKAVATPLPTKNQPAHIPMRLQRKKSSKKARSKNLLQQWTEGLRGIWDHAWKQLSVHKP